MATTSVFNTRKNRLLRKQIPVTENLATLALFGVLVGIVFLVLGQKNNYDPADRDVSIEALQQASSNTQLYNPPLQPWTEPGATSTAIAAIPNLEPFPTAVIDTQWQATGQVRQFDADTLYEKINGEAPKFLKQGFQALHYLVLQSAEHGEIAIELYDQNDMGGSMGVFADHLGGDKTIEQDGDVVYFRTSIGLIGRKGRYFFRIAGESETETVRQKAVQLAQAFAALPEDVSDGPEAFRILSDALGIAPELITFQNKNVFQFDFVENVWFGRFEQASSERIFLHQAETVEQAQQLFAQLLEEQSYDYEIIEESEEQVVLWQPFLKNYFVLSISGQFVYGLENAAEQERIATVLAPLAEVLNNG